MKIMKLVKNDKEFEALYPYTKSNPKKCKHPKRYPCLVRWIEHDGGIGGDYYSCEVIYPPSNGSFIDGVNAKSEILIAVH